jgi:hypothetical protein
LLETRVLFDGVTPTLSDLVHFPTNSLINDPLPDSALIQDIAGDLFGTTTPISAGFAPPSGTLFEVPQGTSSAKTLASFPASIGTPNSQLVMDANGNIYGIAVLTDGTTGTVWRYTAASGALTALATITGGVGQQLVLNQTTGDLYGIGGAATSIFRVPTSGGPAQFLASFANSTTVQPIPDGPIVIDVNGNIFGEAHNSGKNLSDVWEFSNAQLSEFGTTSTLPSADGGGITGGLSIDRHSGAIYGTANGPFDSYPNNLDVASVTIFVIARNASALAPVATLSLPHLAGVENPIAVDSGNTIFAIVGESQFRGPIAPPLVTSLLETWSPGDNMFRTLAVFNRANGQPLGGVLEGNAAANGLVAPSFKFFGVTAQTQDTSNFHGEVWEYGTAGTNVGPGALASYLTNLGTFPLDKTTNDSAPTGGIIRDAAGDIFGTTQAGGPDSAGTLFELTPGASSPMTIAPFTTALGIPDSQLAFDSAGDLFGLAESQYGGSGVVWKLAKGQTTLTSIGTFSGYLDQPNHQMAGLVYDAKTDELFGTVYVDSANDDGALFKIAASATAGTAVTTVAAFGDFVQGGAPIGRPQGAIGIDADGNIFGLCALALWEFSGAGTFSLLSPASALPGGANSAFAGGVTVDAQGHIFGIAINSSDPNVVGSTVFEYFTTGAGMTTVGSFNGSVFGPVAMDPAGTICALVLNDFMTGIPEELADINGNVLAVFNGDNGRAPIGNLLIDQTPNGTGSVDNFNIFGITQDGGTIGGGVDTINPGGGQGTLWEYGVPAEATVGRGPITVTIAQNSITSTFSPGDDGTVHLTLTNNSGVAKSGELKIQLFFSPDGNPLDGVPIQVPSFVSVNLAAGGTQDVIISYGVPADVKAGTEHLVAELEPLTLTESDIDTAPTVDETALQAELLSFGTVNGHRKPRLTDNLDGHPFSCELFGPGTGSIQTDNTGGVVLNLTGTTAATIVAVTSHIGITLDGITADAAVGAIIGRTTTISGGQIDLSAGGVRAMQLADIQSSTIALGGARPAVLVLGNVTDSIIVSTQPIVEMVVNSWTHGQRAAAGSLIAPSIGVLVDRGAFAGNIAAGSSIGAAVILGDLTGDILAGASFGNDHAPGGGDDTFAQGTIGTLLVRGSVSNASTIAAGLSASDDVFPPDGNDTLTAGSRIRALLIAGSLSDDSRVVAATLPPRVRIGRSVVATATDTRFQI